MRKQTPSIGIEKSQAGMRRLETGEVCRPPQGARQVLELHIEELVLRGFQAHDRYAVGDALERELTRLLSRPGALAAYGPEREQAHLDAGDVQLHAGASSDVIGRQIARGIHGGLQA